MAWGEVKKGVTMVAKDAAGIPPKPVRVFDVVTDETAGTNTLTWIAPSDTKVENQPICNVAGIKIVRKEGTERPSSPSDGTVVLDNTDLTVTEYVDTIANPANYSYNAFAYSDHGVYNLQGVVGYSPIFGENSWAQINQAVIDGVADELWAVGDTKDIEISGETITLVIMDFNHDDLADGSGKAGITLGFKNLMTATRQMNGTNTNAGSFVGSAMYTWLTGTLIPSLPQDLQDVMKSVAKKTSAGSQSTTIRTDYMKAFLFAEVEIFGSTTYAVGGEGTIYPYFGTASNRIKFLSNGEGSVYYWWERSPYASHTFYFCTVNTSGTAYSNNASSAYGVCVGLCI